MLCDDVLNEILKYCDQTSLTSFHLINRHMAKKATKHPTILNRKKLAKELTNTTQDYRRYYKSEILNLQIGDRVHDRIHNYRVNYIDKKMGLLERVDMLGNSLGEPLLYAKIDNIKHYHKSKSCRTSLFWSTYHYDSVSLITLSSQLHYGILKHDYGPIISHVDSQYLNYITKPRMLPYKNYHVGTPELGMLVTVDYKWVIAEYYIVILEEHWLKLVLIETDDKNPAPALIANKINNEWKIENKKYSIIFFGGWIIA